MSGLTPGGPEVVGLGGGHGLATTLTAARRYAGRITAIVSVADDGGSSGRLRRDLGMPAPGDVRRCLVALAADPTGPWARAFAGRFERGDLTGHALGNLVIAGLLSATGSFVEAVEEAARLLDACGRVLPATIDPVVLAATVDGQRHVGQKAVEASLCRGTMIEIQPPDARPPLEVIERIRAADQVVLGPGSLFTSVIAVAAVEAIRAALAARAGGVVFVCNLKASKETIGYDVSAHLEALARHGIVPHAVLADPAAMDVGDCTGRTELVTGPLAASNGWSHDPRRLGDALAGLAGPAGLAHPGAGVLG